MPKLFQTLSIVLATCAAVAAAVAGEGPAGHAHDEPAGGHAHGEPATGHAHAAMAVAEDAIERNATPFPVTTEGLPEARPTATVELRDGDRYRLTAAYVKKTVGGRTLRMLAFNGSVPGPFIRAAEGAEVTIDFENLTDLDLTIHSHGLRLDNRFDGVPGITQDPVGPGEQFSYVIRFPDAGVFWYHPHTREDYGQELGLYGNYLVESALPGYWNPVNREVPLVLDDILIEDQRIAKFYREFTNFALIGRFGSDFLVNGEQDYAFEVEKGEVIRFFLTNVSNVRTFNLSLPGVKTKLVGADLGRLEHETFVGNVLISPAERLVVEAYFPTAGTYQLIHTQPDGRVRLASITVTDGPGPAESFLKAFARERHNETVMAEFDELRHYVEAEPDKRLLLTIDLGEQTVDHSMHAHMHSDDGAHDHGEHIALATSLPSDYQPLTPTAEALASLQWADPQQADRTHRTPEIRWQLVDEDTGKVSEAIDDWTFRQGEIVKIRLTNDPEADHVMQHPMHLHGQQFAVLAVDGLFNSNMVWKDTVLVPPDQTVDILVRMTNPGVWMAHCHIAEHLHAGMALTFRVEDADGNAPGDDYRGDRSAAHRH
ncbi:MAG: multicopper oxidase family protein [Woeseiaceae bacterium]|nr:multicopper oxidase family protein [Woeseiaceae bacterium]